LERDVSRPEIEYPCTWSYRIIGSDVGSVTRWVAASLRDDRYELVESNRSRSGKYISIELSVRVESQAQRDQIFRSLQALAGVKVVL